MTKRYPSAPTLTQRHFVVDVADVSTAGSAWVNPGFRGKLKDIYAVIDGAIGTADVTLTAKQGETTLGSVTIPFTGSAAGGVTFGVITGPQHTIAEGEAIEVETDGASSNTVKAAVTLVVEAV